MHKRIPTLISAPTLALALLTACSSSGSSSSSDPADGANQLTCQTFRTTSQDQVDGILTPDELRTQLVDAYTDHGRYASPPIAQASQQLAEAYTQDAPDTVKSDRIRALGQACDDAGH